jgi:hypothetical protein
MTYSPDTLALNPDLARQLKKSRAKTPGGKGHHGHVPDAQCYTTPLPSHAVLCRQNAKTCYNILCGHVGKLNDSELEQRLTAALAALARIGGER